MLAKNILGRIMNIMVHYPDKSKQKEIENIPEKLLLWWEGHRTQDILYTQQH
jgi:hypothetical protein